MSVDVTGLFVVGLLVGVPATVMLWMSPRWRVACFFLGLIFGFGTGALIDSPHDTMAPMIFVGFGISLAAILVEVPAFAVRTIRGRRAAAAVESGVSPAATWDSTQPDMLTAIDADLLAEAFPGRLRSAAFEAVGRIGGHLSRVQWTARFEVNVGGQEISIPDRLRFSSSPQSGGEDGAIYLMARCLESRSNDGFQRQRAVRELLADVQPWSAPFIVALIGEYVIEILNDIYGALEPRAAAVLAEFISANPGYWRTTRARVMSYWDVYYRADFRRGDYVGFKLIDALEEAVRARQA